MSMLFGPSSTDPAAGGLPQGAVLGSYRSHAEARKVVERLAEEEFDVRKISIVGTDLRTVERIRNRLTYPGVVLRSAVQGAFFGLMIGLLMTLIDPAASGIQILYPVGLGVGIWVLFGVIGHAMRRGRGVDSVQQLVPTNFDLVCAFDAAQQARAILGGSPGHQAPPNPPTQQPHPRAPAPRQDRAPGPAQQGPDEPNPAQPNPSQPNPSQPNPAAGPAGPASGTAPAGQGQAEGTGEAAERDWTFPDLPDGRPQFGVRLPEDEAAAVRERVTQANGSGQPGASGEATESGTNAGTGTGTGSGSGSETDQPRRD